MKISQGGGLEGKWGTWPDKKSLKSVEEAEETDSLEQRKKVCAETKYNKN